MLALAPPVRWMKCCRPRGPVWASSSPREALKGTSVVFVAIACVFMLSFTLRGLVGSVAGLVTMFDLDSTFQPAFRTPHTRVPLMSLRGLSPTKLEFIGACECPQCHPRVAPISHVGHCTSCCPPPSSAMPPRSPRWPRAAVLFACTAPLLTLVVTPPRSL